MIMSQHRTLTQLRETESCSRGRLSALHPARHVEAPYSRVNTFGDAIAHLSCKVPFGTCRFLRTLYCWKNLDTALDTPTKYGVQEPLQMLPMVENRVPTTVMDPNSINFRRPAMRNPDRDAGKRMLLEEVRKNVRSFLDADNDGQADGDQPFCYWFGPTNCHRKWIAGSGKELWGIDPDSLKGKLPPFLPDVPVVREDFADYLGEAQAFDAGLGVLIEELKRIGAYENTILVVSGDHGIPGITRGKCSLYDLGTQVPLAIRWPQGIATRGRVVDDFVSLPDLAPTFLEVAGVPIPANMTANSLSPILKSDASGLIEPQRRCSLYWT